MLVISYQRLRSLTTGIGHVETTFSAIQADISNIVGKPNGIMTHQLAEAVDATQPFLRKHLPKRFFDGKYDPGHIGYTEIPPMSEKDRKKFFRKFRETCPPPDGGEAVAHKRITVILD